VVNDGDDAQHDSVGVWAKRYHYASRSMIEAVLRPFGLGSTQWYVLYQLANGGPTLQRDLGQLLSVERATLSGVVATLMRKGLVDQAPDVSDQRQRMLRITAAGSALWRELPDPIAIIRTVSLDGADPDELETTRRVLRAATERLNAYAATIDRG
jgi:DNA-binding MarR family transcriptional regulator